MVFGQKGLFTAEYDLAEEGALVEPLPAKVLNTGSVIIITIHPGRRRENLMLE
jgi:hypothetical protein